MITIEQYDMIIRSLVNTNNRLNAIEADLVISRQNDLDVASAIVKIHAEIDGIDRCLIDNDMAFRNPPRLVGEAEPEETAPPTAAVHHLTFKEPA